MGSEKHEGSGLRKRWCRFQYFLAVASMDEDRVLQERSWVEVLEVTRGQGNCLNIRNVLLPHK